MTVWGNVTKMGVMVNKCYKGMQFFIWCSNITNKSLIFIQENIFYFNSPFLLRSVLVMGWNIFLVAALLKSLYSDTNILSKYIPSLQKKLWAMHFHIVKMYKDKKSKMSRIVLSMCDVKIFLTFTSPNMVLLWQLFYLFCSCI